MNVELGMWPRNYFSGIFVSNFRYWFLAVSCFQSSFFCQNIFCREDPGHYPKEGQTQNGGEHEQLNSWRPRLVQVVKDDILI